MNHADKATQRGHYNYIHAHTDKGVCSSCGRKRIPKKKGPVCILMTLVKGWRLVAYPMSYRVQRLLPNHYAPNGNPTWTDKQRFPRTRNLWVDIEFDCAVAMFHRRFIEAQEHGDHIWSEPRNPQPVGIPYPFQVRQALRYPQRVTYAFCVLCPQIFPHGWRHAYWSFRLRVDELITKLGTRLKRW